jgi:tyrosyl-tRNA synthetase
MFLPVEEQLQILMRGVSDLHGDGELKLRLEESKKSNKPLRVKAGFDPTVPDLHLGHTVLMSKMRQFQKLGHEVIFLIGDFTACIGDPTGRNELRPQLTKEQVVVAAETYARQAFKILDRAQTKVIYNGTWFDKMSANDMVKLAAKYTVARMLERDDFHKRHSAGVPISLHEFLYPLAQGYDSVELKNDIELGGQDQLFNLLVGRDLMKDYGLRPQMVMTTPLLLGTDARLENGALVGAKMSKSKGNYVGIEEPPKDMYGKCMSISDALMWGWYDLLSDKTPTELAQLRADVDAGRVHPKLAKVQLAHEITARFHGIELADAARDEFERVFASHGVPDTIPEVAFGAPTTLLEAIATSGLFASKAEIRRLVSQGGASRNGEKFSDPLVSLDKGEHVLKLGKHKFLKVKIG